MRPDRIPDVRQRVDLAALVEHYAGPGRTTGTKTTFRCPHTSHEDHSPSFTVTGDRWRCWSQCDRSGDAIDLIAWLESCSTAEAIDRLADDARLIPYETRPTKEAPTKAPTTIAPGAPAPSWDEYLAGRSRPLPLEEGRPIVEALCEQRGWSGATATRLGLHAVTDSHNRTRISFAFFEGRHVVWHQDRATDGAEPKWLAPAGRPSVPYEGNRIALGAQRGECFVVEGVTDAVTLINVYDDPAVIGIPGVGAWHAGMAKAFRGQTVFLVADNDQAGQTFRRRVAGDLATAGVRCAQVLVPESHNDLSDWFAAVGRDQFHIELTEAAEAALTQEAA